MNESAHVRIVLGVVLIMALLWAYTRWMDRGVELAVAKNAVAEQTLQQQIQANQALSQQAAAQQLQTQQVMQQLLDANQKLVVGINARSVATKQQQAVDKALPLPDLAERWRKLLDLQPADFVANQQGVEVSGVASYVTVSALEDRATFKQNWDDTQRMADNKQVQINEDVQLLDTKQRQLDGLTAQLTDKDKACAAALDEEKKKSRKSKWGYFWKGLLVGGGVVAYILH